jgi:hypothetical protein
MAGVFSSSASGFGAQDIRLADKLEQNLNISGSTFPASSQTSGSRPTTSLDQDSSVSGQWNESLQSSRSATTAGSIVRSRDLPGSVGGGRIESSQSGRGVARAAASDGQGQGSVERGGGQLTDKATKRSGSQGMFTDSDEDIFTQRCCTRAASIFWSQRRKTSCVNKKKTLLLTVFKFKRNTVWKKLLKAPVSELQSGIS